MAATNALLACGGMTLRGGVLDAPFAAPVICRRSFKIGEGNLSRPWRSRAAGGGVLNLGAVARCGGGGRNPSGRRRGLDQANQRFALSEAATAFQGLYQALDARDAVAAHKPYQLALAQKIGLEIPPTLMTNGVEEASLLAPE
jgi:hypothetical protein